MNLTSWVRQQWRRIVPGAVQTLGALGTPSGGCVVQTNHLPYELRVSTTAPNHTDTWAQFWRWRGEPLAGVQFAPMASPHTYIRVAAGTAPGRGQLECEWVRVSDGKAIVSNPFNVTIIHPVADAG